MSIYDIGTNEVIRVNKSMPLHEVAILMKKNHIGDIVVIENDEPVGIITDRDIALKVAAEDIDVNVCVGEVMSSDLLTLRKDQSVNEALELMSKKGVRRAPIIDENNMICGIVAIDDLLIAIAKELNNLATLISKQIVH